jgi:hypothetical protein
MEPVVGMAKGSCGTRFCSSYLSSGGGEALTNAVGEASELRLTPAIASPLHARAGCGLEEKHHHQQQHRILRKTDALSAQQTTSWLLQINAASTFGRKPLSEHCS